MNATPVVESVAGVRTREPDCCMMTASVPPMLARSLKVETGEPVLGPVLGTALGAADGATLPGAVLGIGGWEPLGTKLGMTLGAPFGILLGTELGPMEGWRLSGLTLPDGELEG